jgi:CDP-diglyceride synthetase
MSRLESWQAAILGVAITALVVLLTIWWRQQTRRWGIVLAACVTAAVLLSWWSGLAFQVADYRAGCDGLCPGHGGAPIPTFRGETAGGAFLPGMFLVNTLVYLVLLLGWSALVRAVLIRMEYSRGPTKAYSPASDWRPLILGLILIVLPLALAPFYLPPPQAHVRGDPQRIAINAQREVYMFDQLASMPVLRVGLEDVRPRRDGQPGMRVCLSTYTLFYLPVGHMYLDMAPEGVHSTGGGVLPRRESCWE